MIWEMSVQRENVKSMRTQVIYMLLFILCSLFYFLLNDLVCIFSFFFLGTSANPNSRMVRSLIRVQIFSTPWTVAYQAPPSRGFSRQEYGSRLPFPSPGDLSDSGIKPGSPALQADALPSEPSNVILNKHHFFLEAFSYLLERSDTIPINPITTI